MPRAERDVRPSVAFAREDIFDTSVDGKSRAKRRDEMVMEVTDAKGFTLSVLGLDLMFSIAGTASLKLSHPPSFPPSPSIMAAQNSAGIQTLLDAEREAQKIVQKAREYRTKRVKDARSEAQSEIEEYRQQKENEFKEFEKQQTSGDKQAEDQAEKDTQKQLDEIKQIGKKTGPKVVDDLLKAVVEVKPEVPNRVEHPTL